MTDEGIVRAVAEKVMGWRCQENGPIGANQFWRSPDWPVIMFNPEYKRWNPLASDADACAVIDRMSAIGFHARYKTPFIIGENHHCRFTPHGCSGWNGVPDFTAEASSRGMAICLAALKAVGMEIE